MTTSVSADAALDPNLVRTRCGMCGKDFFSPPNQAVLHNQPFSVLVQFAKVKGGFSILLYFSISGKQYNGIEHLDHFGCIQTAGKPDSNQIPSQIQYLGLTVYTVFRKCPNEM